MSALEAQFAQKQVTIWPNFMLESQNLPSKLDQVKFFTTSLNYEIKTES